MVFEEIVPLIEVQEVAMSILNATAPIGVDLGLLSLIATSEGEKVEHPRLLRRAERRLKRLQWNLSHKKKGSKNRLRARRRVALPSTPASGASVWASITSSRRSWSESTASSHSRISGS
jgi:Probable transposase